MASVKIRNIEIGSGMPKICVPIVGKTLEEICEAASRIVNSTADLVEWRADWFEEIYNFEKVRDVLGNLRNILGERPVLFTCRTVNEGGQISLTEEQYVMLNRIAVESGKIDLVDVEMFEFEARVGELLTFAHENQVKVVGSYHDFEKTPEKDEIVRKLKFMQKTGADISKIAVMPQDGQDVWKLLAATEEMVRDQDSTPVVTMAMGAIGLLSRIAGKEFGSAITFGTVGKASAPGQLEVEELRTWMEMMDMHELGVLRYIVKTIAQVAKENQIEQVKFVTLEVGTESSYVPYYLNKLFPIAIQYYPEIGKPELKLIPVPGRELQIKELGY